MDDTFRRNLLRRPDHSFESEGPSFQDYVPNAQDGCCRLCCRDESELRKLFPGGYKEELLLRKIFDCTTVQISHTEDSDALICSACEGKVEEFFQYREQCRTNDVLQRQWKRQLGRGAPSTLIPVVSVKCEPDDSEYFGPHELVPLDTHSDGNPDDASAMDEPYNSFRHPEHSSMHLEPGEPEDHNLLELMPPEQSYELGSMNNISQYDNKSDDDNDADFPLLIKQEPEDIDDDAYGWSDTEDPDRSYGDTSMPTGLIPVIEDTPRINTAGAVVLELAPKRVSQECDVSKKALREAIGMRQEIPASSTDDMELGQPYVKRHSNQKSDSCVKHCRFDYKIVKTSKHRSRLLADGHLFVRDGMRADGTKTWRCRKNYDRCRANAEQYPDGTVTVFGTHDHVTENHTERRRNSNGTFAYKFIPSARGNKMLVLDGYRYLKFYSRADGSTLWRCANAPHCKAKASLENDGKVYIKHADAHNHGKTELLLAPDDEESNQNETNITSRTMTNESRGGMKREETADEARTFNKPRASVPGNMAVKCATKSTIAKNRKDADYRIVTNKKGFLALVHHGFRYCKVRVRQDGSIKWVCKMNRKTCHAGLFQLPDGRLEWMNTVRHNHPPTHVDEAPAVVEKETDVTSKYHIDEETFTTSEWYFVRNKKNGTTLVHAGYRYNKKGDRSDKSSLWRCSRAQLGCRAGIVMYPNETISKMDAADHNHGPAPENTDPLIDDSLQGAEPDTGGFLEEEDDPDANMRTLLNFTLGVSTDESVSGCEVLSRAEAGYRFIRNRRHTQSLLFRGYRYCKNTVRVDGTTVWLCQMNKKTCKASVKTLSDGRLVVQNINHNHDRLEEDEDDEDAASASGEVSENNNTTLDRKLANSAQLANDSYLSVQGWKAKSHDYYYAMNRSNRECLIFNQFRYSKANTRVDGSTVWRCMMAGGTCPVSAVILPDGACVSFRGSEHKHPPLSVLPDAVRYPEVQPGSPSKESFSSPKLVITNSGLFYKQHRLKKTKMLSDSVAQFECFEAKGCPAVVKVRLRQNGNKPKILHETPHNHEQASDGTIAKVPAVTRHNSVPGTFQLYKTSRGQLTLIHDGYRFSLRTRQMDGTTSWKCRANKRCSARLHVDKAGTMMATEAKNLSHNHNQNGHTMRWAEMILVKDGSNFGDTVQSCFSEVQAKHAVAAKTIKYSGYTYTMRTVKPSGREHWRCTLFQTKACRAALFCRNNGKIVEHSNSLPHTHKPSAHRVLPIRPKASTAKNTTTTVALNRRPDAQVGLSSAGTRDFEIAGRNGKTIAYQGHRYYWNHQNRDGFVYYRCIRHSSAHCSVVIKLDPTRKTIFPHSKTAHSHSPEAPDDAGPGLTDFSFQRSSRGVTLCHDGYQYWSHNKLSCGMMVYRCRMQRLRCLAAGYYDPREGLFHLRQDVTHNHGISVLSDATEGVDQEADDPTPDEQSALEPIGPESEQQPPSVEQAADDEAEAPGETGIESDEYTFLRKKDGKIALSFAGSLYMFAGKRETADGGSCYIYNCFFDNCDASVELLPSGLVHSLEQNHKRHMPQQVSEMEDLGRGSKDFRLLVTSAGTAVMSFQGYRFYNNNHLSRTREDGSSRWYCQATVAYQKTDKGKIRKRCFVPLVMLPNGCVSSSGTHEHPLSTTMDETMAYMIVDGQRFQFKRKLPNHSSVWRCTEHPSCEAMVYRLKNGKVQSPRPPHYHGAKPELKPSGGAHTSRILNGATATAARVSPSDATDESIKLGVSKLPGRIAPVTIVQSVSMTQFEKAYGRRSFWYFGSRYYFYHTRSDGKQYWRCSSRTTESRCRAGLLRLANGTVIPHNNVPHSHPDQMPGKTDPTIPNPPGMTEVRTYGSNPTSRRMKRMKAREDKEEVPPKVNSTEQQQNPQAAQVEPGVVKVGGTFDYKILNSSDITLEHKGLLYTLSNKPTGGGRVYCCKNEFCKFQLLLLANGELIPFTRGRHICEAPTGSCSDTAFEAMATMRAVTERVVEPVHSVTARSNDSSSFVFPCKTTLEDREIEDPEDFLPNDDDNVNDDDIILPEAKRLRLTLHPDTLERGPDGEPTDEEQKPGDEEDPSTSAWLDVEQEEVIESSYDSDVEGRSGSNKVSAASNSTQTLEEEEGEEGTRTTSRTAIDGKTGNAESSQPRIDQPPRSHSNEEDESNDGSESHSKSSSRAKELVVSAEPHESYARKSSDKSIPDVSPSHHQQR